MSTDGGVRDFVSLGMFIVDEFQFHDQNDRPTGRTLPPQERLDIFSSPIIGGGGTYATVGARIWLPSDRVGMIIDRGHDFPVDIQTKLDVYGSNMWLYRDDRNRGTTRALNFYKGDHRGFKYLTPRVRLTPRDLIGTNLWRPYTLHFICSPTRAAAIISEVKEEQGWEPITVYEPIPDRCIPEELPALIEVLPSISVLSPNAEEALSLLSIPGEPTRALIEDACNRFLDFGVGKEGNGAVIIRSGALGAYLATRTTKGAWIPAYWDDAQHVVDVTGAGNSFLGGLAAGLRITGGDILQAALYGTVSSSFVIEQEGLPRLSCANDGVSERWNEDLPQVRLEKLQGRLCRHVQSR